MIPTPPPLRRLAALAVLALLPVLLSAGSSAATPTAATANAPAAAATGIVSSLDRRYAVRDGYSLRYDLYRPNGAGPYPTVILLHGGGWWRGGRKDLSDATPIAQAFARAGFAAITVDYRLTCGTSANPRTILGFAYTTNEPKCTTGRNHLNEQIADITAALQHVKANAAVLHVDTRRIGLLGASAGGHLALMAALSDADVRAVVNWSGAPSTPFIAAQNPSGGELNIHPSFANAAGCDYPVCQATWMSFSALHRINARTRRFAVLGMSGQSEPQVPIVRIRQFDSALDNLGWRSDVIVGPGACHGTSCASQTVVGQNRTVLQASIAFLAAVLR